MRGPAREELVIGEALRRRLAGNLARFERRADRSAGLRPAAVAIAVLDAGADRRACFLLTRRPLDIKRHRGQWALPGGRLEPDETAAQAALRELAEEVGLALGPEAVLGLLDDYPTRSGFRITPVVAWAGVVGRLDPDPREVERAYRVPLADLERDEVPRLHRIPQSDRPVLSAPIASLGSEVFAPTAALLYQLREVALRGRPTRVAHFEQPVFAWR